MTKITYHAVYPYSEHVAFKRMLHAHYQHAVSSALNMSVGTYAGVHIASSVTTMQMGAYASMHMLLTFISNLVFLPTWSQVAQEQQTTLEH